MSREPARTSAVGRLSGLALAVLLSAGAAACSGDNSPPAEVLGTWMTEAPEYADRTFAITDTTLTLHQGEGRSVTHRIVAVQREAYSGWTEFTFDYDQAGSRLTFSFQYFEPGEIRLRNQEHMVWRRKN